jgi:hypothetical protein
MSDLGRLGFALAGQHQKFNSLGLAAFLLTTGLLLL